MAKLTVRKNWLLAGTASMLSFVAPQVAFAQEAEDPEASTGDTVIIVTANKREERLLEVAGSIGVIGEEQLEQRQALDLQDIARSVGGLNLQQGATPGINRIILRGLNAGGDGATVASIVDDAPLSFSGANTNGAFVASDFTTYDIQRIEVLRGPQGTLYGATSAGGLIRYVTNPANPDSFAGGIEVSGLTVRNGEEDGTIRGYLNAPLSENAAIRVSGYYDGVPGWGVNPQLGEEDINSGRRYGGRVNLFIEPADNVRISGLALYQNSQFLGNGAIEVKGLTDPADQFGSFPGTDRLTYNSFTENSVENEYQLYSLKLEVDADFATLQSITSYGEVDVTSLNDIPSFANVLVPSSSVQSNNSVGLEKLTQEVRLISLPDNQLFGAPIDWQLGFFYTRETVDFLQDINVLSQPSADQIAQFSGALLPSRFEDVAGYANATINFSDRFDVELGIRVARNNQRSQLTQSGLAIGGITIENPVVRSAETATTFHVAPRLFLNDDLMIYARVASGYRPGGPQVPIPGAPPGLPTDFQNDTTLNYEAGLKGTLGDGLLTIDLAAFYIDWSDVQVLTQIVVGGNGFTLTGNVGKATSQGFEWGIDLRPADGLTFSLIGSYTDAEFTRDAPVLGIQAGNNLPYVADLNNTFAIDYEFPVSTNWDGFVGGSWTYNGERVSDYPFGIELPSYSTFDAQIGVRGDGYSVQLFAKNLTDEEGFTNYVPVGGFSGGGILGITRPRTIGLRLAADF